MVLIKVFYIEPDFAVGVLSALNQREFQPFEVLAELDKGVKTGGCNSPQCERLWKEGQVVTQK